MAEVTIADLTKAVVESSSNSKKRDDAQLKELASINKHFSDYFKAQKLASGDKEEEKRDAKRKEKKSKGPKLSGAMDEAKKGGFLGIVAGIVGALSGLVVGMIEGFVKAAKVLLKPVTFVIKGLNKLLKPFSVINFLLRPLIELLNKSVVAFKKTVPKLKVAITKFRVVVKGITDAFDFGIGKLKGGVKDVTGRFRKLTKLEGIAKSLGKVASFFKPIGKSISTIIVSVKSLSKPFVAFGEDVSKLTNMVSKQGKKTGGIISKIGGFFKSFGSIFGKFFTIFRTLGRVIFFPLTIIMTMVDAFKGFKEGFAKDGAIGGIIGAISGVLVGLIGMPLDLLKSVVGWVASKLGFENFSETLAEFSFSDMIKTLFGNITDTIMGFIDGIKDDFANMSFGEAIAELGKKLWNVVSGIFKFPFAVAAGGAAAIGALVPGGKSPMEAFSDTFNGVMNGMTFDTNTSEKIQSRQKEDKIGNLQNSARDREARAQTASNVVIQDNSTTSAPAAPSQAIPLPGPSLSFDAFDPGTRTV